MNTSHRALSAIVKETILNMGDHSSSQSVLIIAQKRKRKKYPKNIQKKFQEEEKFQDNVR